MPTDIKTVTIRRMIPEDIDRIIEIEQNAYGDHHWSKSSFMNELSNDLAWYYTLLDNNSNIAGYAGTWHILDEAHITNIAIDINQRHKKYGEALLKRIIDDCYKENIKYITLEVRISNKAAIGLYSKYGFTSFGTRKGYYQDNNEDANIMWTKNIFYDEFKGNYQKVCEKLQKEINIV